MNTLQAWLMQFESRTLRERVLIATTVLACIWGSWFTLWGAPAIDQLAADESALKRLTNEMHALLGQPQNNAGANRKMLEQQRAQLQQQLMGQRQRVQELMNGYVQPQDVAELLRTMLAAHPGIELKQLKNLPGEMVQVGDADTGIYRHRVELQLTGSYVAIVNYLQALEGYTAGLRWRAVSYAVVDHPLAEVSIQVETLSHEQAWVRV